MNTLQGRHVLVTRPSDPGRLLCDLIREKGGEALLLPTIEFAPPPDEAAFRAGIAAIGEQDWVIFVSQQAVRASVSAIRAAWPVLPAKTQFAAVGAITAAALHDAGYHALYPEHDWSSEALVAMPALQNLLDKKVAIVRGEGGRDILETELAARGALITSIVAYERALPALPPGMVLKSIVNAHIDAIVCASFESVRNLKTLVGDAGWPHIENVPLIVVSERIKTLAQALGFQTIWVANNASHQAIIDVISKGKSQ